MKKLSYLFLVIILFAACRSNMPAMMEPVVLTNKDSSGVKEEKKEVPADSSWFYAYFKCDSNNKVIMASLNNGSTQGLQSNISFNEGVLNIKTVKPKDSISVFSTFRFVYTDRPVPRPYPVEKALTKWQKLIMTLGYVFLGILSAGLFFLAFKIYKKIRK